MAADRRVWREALGGTVSPGDVIAGKYRLDRIVGIGGMGVVVEGWHLDLEERVAVKFLLPARAAKEKTRERFRREARAGFKITSEHIARVFDLGTLDSGLQYMAMEYLRGQTLSQLLEVGSIRPAVAVGYVLQACEAVAEAHALGYVHRDIKPDNLFLCQRADGSPCVKVLDFGLAKDAGLPRSITRVNRGMGTPRYMSPEQWLSARDVGPEADIWALGVVLFELIAGVPPFDSPELGELSQLVLFAEAPRLGALVPGVPGGLDDVLARCFAKKPSERYATVSELVAALLPFAPHVGLRTTATSGSMPPPPGASWALTLSETEQTVLSARDVAGDAAENLAATLEHAGPADPPTLVDAAEDEWPADPAQAEAAPARRSRWRSLALAALALGISAAAAVVALRGETAPSSPAPALPSAEARAAVPPAPLPSELAQGAVQEPPAEESADLAPGKLEEEELPSDKRAPVRRRSWRRRPPPPPPPGKWVPEEP